MPPAYFAAGIEEYWLVDARRADLLFQIHARGTGAFEPVSPDGDGWQPSHRHAHFISSAPAQRPDGPLAIRPGETVAAEGLTTAVMRPKGAQSYCWTARPLRALREMANALVSAPYGPYTSHSPIAMRCPYMARVMSSRSFRVVTGSMACSDQPCTALLRTGIPGRSCQPPWCSYCTV